MAKPDGVIVPGDVVKRNRHKKVLNHNYLPLLTQGTPSFIKKGTAGNPAGKPPLRLAPTHLLNLALCTLKIEKTSDNGCFFMFAFVVRYCYIFCVDIKAKI